MTLRLTLAFTNNLRLQPIGGRVFPHDPRYLTGPYREGGTAWKRQPFIAMSSWSELEMRL